MRALLAARKQQQIGNSHHKRNLEDLLERDPFDLD
jgi:hypothetical protein